MLLAVFSALCLSTSAQITVTSATFPVSGDTLRFAYDEGPVGVNNPATPPGGNQTWDFTGLSADQTNEFIYKPAGTGMHAADFPGADLLLEEAGGETYFNVTNTKMEVLGYAGADPAGFGLDVSTPFWPALIERRSPLNFLDAFNQQSMVNINFPTDQPPFDTIFSGLPVNLDSLRVSVTTFRVGAVDAWGTCHIPGGQYPVLREKRTDYVNTAIQVYVALFPGFGTWVDLESFLPSGTGGISDFIGTDTTTTYRFYSGTEKEEIAVATMSNDLGSVERMRFKHNVTSAAPEVPGTGSAGISAFPNPAIDFVRFDCINLPQDDYTLKIFNIIGKVVWKENYQLAGNRSFRVELDNFKKGTYLYSLTNKKGNVIGTKRLVVLKP